MRNLYGQGKRKGPLQEHFLYGKERASIKLACCNRNTIVCIVLSCIYQELSRIWNDGIVWAPKLCTKFQQKAKNYFVAFFVKVRLLSRSLSHAGVYFTVLVCFYIGLGWSVGVGVSSPPLLGCLLWFSCTSKALFIILFPSPLPLSTERCESLSDNSFCIL